MSGMGLVGSARPKARAGDFERALALMVEVGGDKQTRKYLEELVAAEATYVESRERATAATAEAERREAAALEAEETARSDLAELAAHQAAYDTCTRNERATLEAERRRLDDLAKKLDDEGIDLNRREAALRTAFDAYQGAMTK